MFLTIPYYMSYNKNKAQLCLRHNHAICFSSSFIFFTYFRCKDKNTFWTFNKKNRKRLEKKTQSFAYLANDCVFSVFNIFYLPSQASGLSLAVSLRSWN